MFLTRPLKMLPTMLRELFALDAIFFEPAVFEQRDAALEFFDVDDEFVAGLATRQAQNSFHLFYHKCWEICRSHAR